MNVLESAGEAVALVKPQFEVGRSAVGKGGVVRDPAQHRAVVARVARYAVLRLARAGCHRLAAPRPQGQPGVLLHVSRRGRTPVDLETMIDRSVEVPA